MAHAPEQIYLTLHMCPTALLLWFTYKPHITVHTKTSATGTLPTIAKYVPERNMPLNAIYTN